MRGAADDPPHRKRVNPSESAQPVPDRLASFLEALSPDLPRPSPEHLALLEAVRVVLVEPRHPGNIGSAARAMEVTGLSHLYLVRPAPWREGNEAWALACGARDVLERAVEVDTLDEAIGGVTTAVGTTHRMGRARGPLVPPHVLAGHLRTMIREGPVALVFGREDKGLSNDELARCQMGVHIPTAGSYPSLNLSHAVMVIAYECFWGILTDDETRGRGQPLSYPAVVALAERIVKLTGRTGFEHRRGTVGFERSLRQAIERSTMTERDLTLVHLVCRHVERYMDALERGLSPDEARQAPPDSPETRDLRFRDDTP